MFFFLIQGPTDQVSDILNSKQDADSAQSRTMKQNLILNIYQTNPDFNTKFVWLVFNLTRKILHCFPFFLNQMDKNEHLLYISN